MSTSKKPLEPDDFPVTAEGQKIKKQEASPSPLRRTMKPLPTWPSASTTTKRAVRKTSGRPERLLSALQQSVDQLQQLRALRTPGATTQELADIRIGDLAPELMLGWCFTTGVFDRGSRVSTQTSPLLLS